MGGRGKTPFVAFLTRRLLAAGERPAILSRGYGRRIVEDGVVIVSDGVHLLADLDRAGDEPLMLARALPGAMVLVCEQRAIAATLATRALGATVLILDDGFQHRAMRRDVDLVIVAATDLRARRVPFGPLRETRTALQRASAVITDGEFAAADRNLLPQPVFAMLRRLGTPMSLEPRHALPSPGARVVALAAIAQPDRFTRALESAGWLVTRTVSFRDHHRYTSADIRVIASAVRDTGAAAVLTTDKDATRLLPWRPLPVPVAAVPLDVSIEPAAAFDAWLDLRLREVRRC